LLSGKSSVMIHCEEVSVRAEIAQLESASAHANGNELMAWLR
jgi:metallo-beta-lactamase family protein